MRVSPQDRVCDRYTKFLLSFDTRFTTFVKVHGFGPINSQNIRSTELRESISYV